MIIFNAKSLLDWLTEKIINVIYCLRIMLVICSCRFEMSVILNGLAYSPDMLKFTWLSWRDLAISQIYVSSKSPKHLVILWTFHEWV